MTKDLLEELDFDENEDEEDKEGYCVSCGAPVDKDPNGNYPEFCVDCTDSFENISDDDHDDFFGFSDEDLKDLKWN